MFVDAKTYFLVCFNVLLFSKTFRKISFGFKSNSQTCKNTERTKDWFSPGRGTSTVTTLLRYICVSAAKVWTRHWRSGSSRWSSCWFPLSGWSNTERTKDWFSPGRGTSTVTRLLRYICVSAAKVWTRHWRSGSSRWSSCWFPLSGWSNTERTKDWFSPGRGTSTVTTLLRYICVSAAKVWTRHWRSGSSRWSSCWFPLSGWSNTERTKDWFSPGRGTSTVTTLLRYICVSAAKVWTRHWRSGSSRWSSCWFPLSGWSNTERTKDWFSPGRGTSTVTTLLRYICVSAAKVWTRHWRSGSSRWSSCWFPLSGWLFFRNIYIRIFFTKISFMFQFGCCDNIYKKS